MQMLLSSAELLYRFAFAVTTLMRSARRVFLSLERLSACFSRAAVTLRVSPGSAGADCRRGGAGFEAHLENSSAWLQDLSPRVSRAEISKHLKLIAAFESSSFAVGSAVLQDGC